MSRFTFEEFARLIVGTKILKGGEGRSNLYAIIYISKRHLFMKIRSRISQPSGRS